MIACFFQTPCFFFEKAWSLKYFLKFFFKKMIMILIINFLFIKILLFVQATLVGYRVASSDNTH